MRIGVKSQLLNNRWPLVAFVCLLYQLSKQTDRWTVDRTTYVSRFTKHDNYADSKVSFYSAMFGSCLHFVWHCICNKRNRFQSARNGRESDLMEQQRPCARFGTTVLSFCLTHARHPGRHGLNCPPYRIPLFSNMCIATNRCFLNKGSVGTGPESTCHEPWHTS